MNLPRYAVAGGLSLLIHGAILFVAKEPKAFAMPAGQTSNAVSINFQAMTVPAAEEPQPVQPEPVVEKKAPVVEETVVEAPQSKKAITEQNVTAAPKKTVTPAETPVKKPIEKKPETKKVTKKVEQKPKQSDKPKQFEKKEPTEKVVKKEPTPVEEKPKDIAEKPQDTTEKPAQSQPVNAGASSQPVLVSKPTFVARPTAPKYPRLAKKRGIQGVATYEIWLDEEGKQVRQALVTSSGALMLDKAALNAIKQWQFSPHIVNGVAIAHRVKIPVRFKLD
ncbi:energy transducer TonB [Vibrio maerlii]|uniref:energy transducer TonB n=1 Tax=Vibrio maerlii TaxID=2231648 RepID=UPI000E3EDDE6|nr:energy transducer TonB [Vibrio maerlii]